MKDCKIDEEPEVEIKHHRSHIELDVSLKTFGIETHKNILFKILN